MLFVGLRPAPRVHPRQQPDRAGHQLERDRQRCRRREQRARGRRDSWPAWDLRRLGHDAVDVHVPLRDDCSVEQLYRDRNRHPTRRACRVRFRKRDGPEGYWEWRCAWGGGLCSFVRFVVGCCVGCGRCFVSRIWGVTLSGCTSWNDCDERMYYTSLRPSYTNRRNLYSMGNILGEGAISWIVFPLQLIYVNS